MFALSFVHSKFQRKHLIVLLVSIVVLVLCLVCVAFGRGIISRFGSIAPNDVEEVVLTAQIDETNQPVNPSRKFSIKDNQIISVNLSYFVETKLP
jgi:hypothetical protein